jgi:hypothetical protein
VSGGGGAAQPASKTTHAVVASFSMSTGCPTPAAGSISGIRSAPSGLSVVVDAGARGGYGRRLERPYEPRSGSWRRPH